MSLKHKNTSKWAKAQNKYAKYSEKARDEVQEQLELSKQLTKKVKRVELENDEDEDENEKNEQEKQLVLNQNGLLVNNPWMKMMKGVGQSSNETDENENKESRLNDEFSKPKAFNDQAEIEKAQRELADDQESEDESDDSDNLEIAREKESNKQVASIFKKNDTNEKTKINEKTKGKTKKVKFVKEVENQKEAPIVEKTSQEAKIVLENNIEPVFESKTVRNFKNVEDSNDNHDEDNNNKDHQITLSEAFADDDVIEEFKMEKVAFTLNYD
jgi:U3 small nucleolar RNA-associated protein 14